MHCTWMTVSWRAGGDRNAICKGTDSTPSLVILANGMWLYTHACRHWMYDKSIVKSYTRCFFRPFKVRCIVQESHIYHRVGGSLLHQNPLSIISANFHLPTTLLNSFQSIVVLNFRSFIRKRLWNEETHRSFATTRLNAIMGILMVEQI